jgi:ElaB/YqjD/DUF883 family membrane-anchored ribosome-binding protein
MPEGAGTHSRADGPLVGAARNIEAAATRAKDAVVGAIDGAGDKTIRELVQGSRDMVRENPMKAVLISVGVGALLGYMLARR